MTTIFTSHRFSLDKCPTNLQKNLESWGSLNSSYQFKYYNDEQMTEWMRNNTDQETFSLFDKLNTGAGKADVFRVWHLHIAGGIWVDADLPAFDINKQRPDFSKLLQSNSSVIVRNRKCNEPRYTLMASVNGENIFGKLGLRINDKIKWAMDTGCQLGTIHITGPFVLHEILCELLSLDTIKLLPIESNEEFSFVYIDDIVPEKLTYQEENVYKGYESDLIEMRVVHHDSTKAVD